MSRRAPVFTRLGRAPRLPCDAQNLLCTTLAAAVVSVAPFHPVDWPGPTRNPAPLYNQPPNLLPLATAAASRPLTRWDWTPGAIRRSLRAQFDAPNLLLSTLASQTVEAPPFITWDWETRKRAAPRRGELQRNLLAYQLVAAPEQRPFAAWDWGNLLAHQLVPALGPRPFAVHDWPLPKHVQVFRADPPLGLFLTTLRPVVSGAPILAIDWHHRPRQAKAFAPTVQNLLLSVLAPEAEEFPLVRNWKKEGRRARRRSRDSRRILDTRAASRILEVSKASVERQESDREFAVRSAEVAKELAGTSRSLEAYYKDQLRIQRSAALDNAIVMALIQAGIVEKTAYQALDDELMVMMELL